MFEALVVCCSSSTCEWANRHGACGGCRAIWAMRPHLSDEMDDDDLDRIREARLRQMKKAQEKKEEYIRSGVFCVGKGSLAMPFREKGVGGPAFPCRPWTLPISPREACDYYLPPLMSICLIYVVLVTALALP